VFPDRLELLSRYKADFLGPCHVSVSERGDFVYFASYGKGTVAVFRINEDGGLAFSSMVRHEGRGAHPLRQDRPHPHFAAERDRQLFVVDLGLDKVFVYNIDAFPKAEPPASTHSSRPRRRALVGSLSYSAERTPQIGRGAGPPGFRKRNPIIRRLPCRLRR
jgi:6-phosphogluconolactonase (cycloisomerase 2 family)